MDWIVVIDGVRYRIDSADARSLARGVDFTSMGWNPFRVPCPSREPLRLGGFLGDTRRGGSCNVPVVQFIPHCHGTHTESISHVVDEPIAVHEILPAGLIPALLIRVFGAQEVRDGSGETRGRSPGAGIVTSAALEMAMDRFPTCDRFTREPAALVVLACPEETERSIQFRAHPPTFSSDAMQLIRQHGFSHLLVDFPSVDPLDDDGRLANHRVFWDLPAEGHSLDPGARGDCTITELIVDAPDLAEGWHLMDLQVPALALDAVPSRPLLYPLRPLPADGP